MIRTRLPVPPAFVALLGTVLLGACGGPKRPPAVATAPPAAETPVAGPSYGDTQPVDAGPEIRPFGGADVGSEDFTVSGPDGEGGPLADVHFGFDESNLTEEARGTLERHALWLQTHREARVTLEGHCDERGTVEYNLALGDLRAQAARDYLISLGVAPDRLTAVSYGKERPLDAGHDEAAWARNRRVHFAVAR